MYSSTVQYSVYVLSIEYSVFNSLFLNPHTILHQAERKNVLDSLTEDDLLMLMKSEDEVMPVKYIHTHCLHAQHIHL